jgi:hypothetical protein
VMRGSSLPGTPTGRTVVAGNSVAQKAVAESVVADSTT